MVMLHSIHAHVKFLLTVLLGLFFTYANTDLITVLHIPVCQFLLL